MFVNSYSTWPGRRLGKNGRLTDSKKHCAVCGGCDIAEPIARCYNGTGDHAACQRHAVGGAQSNTRRLLSK